MVDEFIHGCKHGIESEKTREMREWMKQRRKEMEEKP